MSVTRAPLATGEMYHVYNRGVDKRGIFMDKNDYVRFYQLLHFFNTTQPLFSLRHARMNSGEIEPLVAIHAYALLDNHYHIILEQLVDNGISQFMKKIGGGYTNYFNHKYERSGSLFQGTYKRVHIKSDEKYNYLLAYVNENHIVHNIKQPGEIMYSSSLHYRKKLRSRIIEQELVKNYNTIENQKLAKEIYKSRKFLKDELLE